MTRRIEYGDFQTPQSLAARVCRLISDIGLRPAAVVEPTCGEGAFLAAAANAFPQAALYGCECNPRYADAARTRMSDNSRLRIDTADFFSHDWDAALAALGEPILVLGNPPWVTNATVGVLGGRNLPSKSNADGLQGLHAITGSANFDISEWMIRQNIRWLDSRNGAIAVLCKTSVARKILRQAWATSAPLDRAAIYHIDAASEFGVAVDACLLYARVGAARSQRCEVYASLESKTPTTTIGYRDGLLIGDMDAYERQSALRGDGLVCWRSGVKHDCSRVFELRYKDGSWRNGLDEPVCVEEEVVYPLLKSSDVAHGRTPCKRVLVSQRSMSESPLALQQRAPRAWRYLLAHQDDIARRGSAIYRNRPPFSMFGVGAYSFAPWKVAIAGLYKTLRFVKIAPFEGRPVLLDDTCYFLPCETEADCDLAIELLASKPATEFLSALTFWDAKRPITAKVLNQLDLVKVAKRVGNGKADLARSFARLDVAGDRHQPALL